jgi:2-oxoglutarate dehydrogenase complex dehydrogenase (E1) component-like enzyme
MREGLLPEELLREHVTRVNSILENGMQEAKSWSFKADALHLSGSKWSGFVQPSDMTAPVPTGCPTATLVDVGVSSVRVPAGFTPHSRLERLFMAARVQKLQKNEPLDWPTCEAVWDKHVFFVLFMLSFFL